MKDFTSSDGSFGFGGFDQQSMMQVMIPALKEFEAEIKNEEFVIQILDKIRFLNPLFEKHQDRDTHAGVICTILAIKKYGLSEDMAVQLAAKKEIVEWCFTKYMEENAGNIDELFPTETVVQLGNGMGSVSISASEMSREAMLLNMAPILAATTEVVEKNEKYRYTAQKMLNKLKSTPLKDSAKHEMVFAMVLHVRYNRTFDECFELVKEGKALDTCFEEYMKEIGTGIVSDMMGEPPSSTAH